MAQSKARDVALLLRLRDSIQNSRDDDAEEEQLRGVLRMIGKAHKAPPEFEQTAFKT